MDLSFTYCTVLVLQAVQLHTLLIRPASNAENVTLSVQRVQVFITVSRALLLITYYHSIVKIKQDVWPNVLSDFGQIQQCAKVVMRTVKAAMVPLSISV